MIRSFKHLILPVFLLFSYGKVFSQVSNGGFPQKVFSLKSSKIAAIEMPELTREMIASVSLPADTFANRQKPLRFAYPFEVNLNPENAGVWGVSENGTWCWRLNIRSKDAKSINIIFDNFNLPANTKLFVFNENKVLGAFTDYNNKKSGKFAVAPVSGDEITVQYEVQEKDKSVLPFTIIGVNHDFLGILAPDPWRPVQGAVAGACNVDINCDVAEHFSDVKNSVCRMIVNGAEVCTGTLLNNTSENQKPYILSAEHCYDKISYAETTVYVFGFESPFCAPLDGDPFNSVSGAVMKARFDSLDFALVELSLVPPPEYRPYYAGWNKNSQLPDSSVCIHHPQGNIKKIAVENNPVTISSFNSNYKSNAFLRVARWEAGVTEAGSSGGPLFNRQKQMVGTLTGGVATCADPVRDYFSRFSMAWDYKSDSARQLKYWLDPLKSGKAELTGKNFNTAENLCGAFTNLVDGDSFANVPISSTAPFKGYWGGSNSEGFTEFAERFIIPGNPTLSGISLGIGKLKLTGSGSQSEITIKVYNGKNKPETLIHSEKIRLASLHLNSMNFIGFNAMVEPSDTFFVGFELSNLQATDTFAVYQSYRKSYEINNHYLKSPAGWKSFSEVNASGRSMTNVMELIACNIDYISTDTPLINNPMEILLYPNPANSVFLLEAGQQMATTDISIYNLIGQEVEAKITLRSAKKAEINLAGNQPGVYIVHLKTVNGRITRKISYVPW